MQQRILLQIPRVNTELHAFLTKFVEDVSKLERIEGDTVVWNFHVRTDQAKMIEQLLITTKQIHEGSGTMDPPHLIFLEYNAELGETPNSIVATNARLVEIGLTTVNLVGTDVISLEEVSCQSGGSVDAMLASLLGARKENT